MQLRLRVVTIRLLALTPSNQTLVVPTRNAIACYEATKHGMPDQLCRLPMHCLWNALAVRQSEQCSACRPAALCACLCVCRFGLQELDGITHGTQLQLDMVDTDAMSKGQNLTMSDYTLIKQ